MNKNNAFGRHIAAYVFLYLLFYLLTYTELLPLSIGNATPQLLVPITVAVGFFYGEWAGFSAGMIAGIFADAVSADTVCFNMIALMLIGLASGLMVNHYINRNIFSALMLSVSASAVYFIFHWLIFFVAAGFTGKLQFFLYHSLPSIVYSSLFILIAYLPGRYLKKP